MAFSSIVLDRTSHLKLVNFLKAHTPKGWEVVAHHITTSFKGPAPDLRKKWEYLFWATDYAIDDKVMAVKVQALTPGIPIENAIPHCTIAVNRAGGGKPVDSNNLTDWISIREHHVVIVGQFECEENEMSS